MTTYHLAQCNIGRVRAPLDSPTLSGFVAALEPINQLADETPGFVWRLETEDGDATAIRAFDDDMLLINMSVWQSIEALGDFVYRSAHRDVMRQRAQWFEKMDTYMVLWWIPAATVPSVADAKERLDMLRRDGPTPGAFTFRSPFPAPDAQVDTDAVPDDWLCATGVVRNGRTLVVGEPGTAAPDRGEVRHERNRQAAGRRAGVGAGPRSESNKWQRPIGGRALTLEPQLLPRLREASDDLPADFA
jgi:hypothetical protein